MVNNVILKTHPDFQLLEMEKFKLNYLKQGHTIAIYTLLITFVSQVQFSF